MRVLFVVKSFVTNLFVYQKYILSALEQGKRVDAIYTDFRKAFDSVDHTILINKLYALGLRDELLLWINSFVSDRRQIVKFKNYFSRDIEVCSGVPQGSHLGPLLFILFINDINVPKHCKFLLYADDLKIYKCINTGEDALQLQQDLRRLEAWSCANMLFFNTSKCYVIRFNRRRHSIDNFDYVLNNKILSSVDQIRDLGITFTCDLTYGLHIRTIVGTAFRTLGFIYRAAKYFKCVTTIKTLFITLVRPILEYGSVIWSPYYIKNCILIERIQHRFFRLARYCMRDPMPITCHDYQSELLRHGLLTLENRRILLDLLFLHNVFNGRVACSEILQTFYLRTPTKRIRSCELFHVDFHCTNYGRFNSANRICILANNYATSADVFHESFGVFRRRMISVLSF